MSESPPNQEQVADLVAQMQAGNEALATDAQALKQAADAAQQIAADAQATAAPAAAATKADFSPEVQRLLAIEVPIIVQLGVRRMAVGEVMRLSVGSIIEFHKSSDEELDLLANNQSIGKGFAVKVGENFGIKLTSIASVKETIRRLGGA
jgi:flagellar motor switch protein FliN